MSYEDKVLIRQAVQLAPMQSAGSLMRNIQDSPTKQIEYSLSNSVKNLVRQERRGITNFLLDSVEIENTLGSLSRLTDQIWFPTPLPDIVPVNELIFSRLLLLEDNFLIPSSP